MCSFVYICNPIIDASFCLVSFLLLDAYAKHMRSTVYVIARCPAVRPSVCHKPVLYLKSAEQIELVFAFRLNGCLI